MSPRKLKYNRVSIQTDLPDLTGTGNDGCSVGNTMSGSGGTGNGGSGANDSDSGGNSGQINDNSIDSSTLR